MEGSSRSKGSVYVPDAQETLISEVLAREIGLFINWTSVHDFTLDAPSTGFSLSGTCIDRIMHVRDHGDIPQYRRPQNLHSHVATTRSKFSLNTASNDPTPITEASRQRRSDPTHQSDSAPSALPPSVSSSPNTEPTKSSNSHIWHRRLIHASLRTIRKIASLNLPPDEIDCEPCDFAKAHKLPFPLRDPSTWATEKLYRIHSDLCIVRIRSLGKSIYYLTFLDELTRYCGYIQYQTKKRLRSRNAFSNGRPKPKISQDVVSNSYGRMAVANMNEKSKSSFILRAYNTSQVLHIRTSQTAWLSA